MKRHYILLSLLAAIAFITSCSGQSYYDMNKYENNHEYEICSHERIYGENDTEDDIITVNEQLIQSLPQAVKIIIARYSSFMPDYMLNEEQQEKFAKSLGYGSLDEAQESSLKEWGSDFSLTKSPVYFYLIKTEDYIIFKYGFVYGTDYVEDKFKISKKGEITFVDRKNGNRFN